MNLTPKQQADAISAFANNERISSIAARMGLARVTLWRKLRALGVPMKAVGNCRKYALNQSAFDSVTDASAYWVGFLMADGCVIRHGNSYHVQVTAAERDAAHIAKFRSFLDYDGPIRIKAGRKFSGATCSVKTPQPMHGLTVTSTQLAAALIGFGVTPRKSHTASVVGLEANRHFWRGVVDGDGTVMIGRQDRWHVPLLLLCGARPLLEQWASFVRKSIGHVPTIHPQNTIFAVRLTGHAAERMAHVLYDDCSVALDRKLDAAHAIFARAEKILSNRRGNRVCSVPGCPRQYHSRGLCRPHRYGRLPI